MIFALSGVDLSRLGISTGRTVTQTATGRDITLTRTDPTLAFIQSGQSTRDIISRGEELQRQQKLGSIDVQEQIHENLRGLGQASIDLSAAISQIAQKVSIPGQPQIQPKEESAEVATAAAKINESSLSEGFAQIKNQLGSTGLLIGAAVLGIILLKK
jgi:hypothetical protein